MDKMGPVFQNLVIVQPKEVPEITACRKGKKVSVWKAWDGVTSRGTGTEVKIPQPGHKSTGNSQSSRDRGLPSRHQLRKPRESLSKRVQVYADRQTSSMWADLRLPVDPMEEGVLLVRYPGGGLCTLGWAGGSLSHAGSLRAL